MDSALMIKRKNAELKEDFARLAAKTDALQALFARLEEGIALLRVQQQEDAEMFRTLITRARKGRDN